MLKILFRLLLVGAFVQSLAEASPLGVNDISAVEDDAAAAAQQKGKEKKRLRTLLSIKFDKIPYEVLPPEDRPIVFHRIDILEKQAGGAGYKRVNKWEEFTGKSLYIVVSAELLKEVFKGNARMTFASRYRPQTECEGELENQHFCHVVVLRIEGPGKNCAYLSAWVGDQGERTLQVHLDPLDPPIRPLVGQAIAVYADIEGKPHYLKPGKAASEFKVLVESKFQHSQHGTVGSNGKFALLYVKHKHLPGVGSQKLSLEQRDSQSIVVPLQEGWFEEVAEGSSSARFVPPTTSPSEDPVVGTTTKPTRRTLLTVNLEKLPPAIRPLPFQRIDVFGELEDGSGPKRLNKWMEFTGKSVYIEVSAELIRALFKGDARMSFAPRAWLSDDKPDIKCESNTEGCHVVVLRQDGPGKNCGYVGSKVGKHGERTLCLDVDALDVSLRPLVGQTITIFEGAPELTYKGRGTNVFMVLLEKEYDGPENGEGKKRKMKEKGKYTLLYSHRDQLPGIKPQSLVLEQSADLKNKGHLVEVSLEEEWFEEEAEKEKQKS